MSAAAVAPGRDTAVVVETDSLPGEHDSRVRVGPTAFAILAVGTNLAWLLPMRDDMGGTHMALALLIAAGFASAGAVAMHVRPGSRVGTAMLALAFVVNLEDGYFETLLPWRFTIGMAVSGMTPALLAFLALSFPAGRLRGRWTRLLCLALGSLAATFVVMRLLWFPPAALCLSCPPAGNVLFVENAPFDVLPVLDRLAVAFAVLVALVMATLLTRWLRASRPARRVLGPVVLTTVLLTAKVTLDLLVLAPDLWGESFGEVRLTLIYPNQLLTALIPLTFLLAVVRSEFGRSPLARLLSDVVDDQAPARVDRALAAALGDPGVRVGYRTAAAEGFVDLDGRPLEVPGPDAPVRATFLGDPEDPFAVIVHDTALGEDDRQLEAAAAAAGMTLRRERLRAELRMQLQQLSESRERLIHAVDNQRVRMESALERGVEDRLGELTAILDDLRPELDHPPALETLEDVAAEVHRAKGDLRAFVNGVRPAIIAADGLESALHDMARSAAVPVTVTRAPDRRLPAAVENAVWFVCSESIVNVAKHAHASHADVDVHVGGGEVLVSVADDGRGGAAEANGSGLLGLRERVEALGGTLSVTSGRGGGTTVVAKLPL